MRTRRAAVLLSGVLALGGVAACGDDAEQDVRDGVQQVEEGAEDLGGDLRDGAEELGDGLRDGAEELQDGEGG